MKRMTFSSVLFPFFQMPTSRLSLKKKHGYFLYKFGGSWRGLPGVVVEMLGLGCMHDAGSGSAEGTKWSRESLRNWAIPNLALSRACCLSSPGLCCGSGLCSFPSEAIGYDSALKLSKRSCTSEKQFKWIGLIFAKILFPPYIYMESDQFKSCGQA